MAQTVKSTVYLTTTEWAKASHSPVNGFGGDLYEVAFEAPTYNSHAVGVQSDISWSLIDYWGQSTGNVLAIEGIGLGLCLTTLCYVIALTPAWKRGTKPGISQFSSYLFLTLDYGSTTYSSSYKAIRIMSLIAACFTIFFTLICLGIQANGLLSGVRIKKPMIYRIIMGYLCVASCVALCWRSVYAGLLIALLAGKTQSFNHAMVHRAMLISYSISIGSWSLVSLFSTCWLIWTRTRMILSTNRIYNSVLNLIALICMESFLVPSPPSFETVVHPEAIVIPSVLVLLPLGSLFMTIHQAEIPNSNNFRPSQPQSPAVVLPNPESPFHAGEAYPLEPIRRHQGLRSNPPPPPPPPATNNGTETDSDENELHVGSYETDKVIKSRAKKITRNLHRKFSNLDNISTVSTPGTERSGRSFV